MTQFFLGSAIIAIITCSSLTSGLKILGISTLPSPSHHIWFTELMRGLAQNGHQIYALGLKPTELGEDGVAENQTVSFVFEDVMDNYHAGEWFDPIQWSQWSAIRIAWYIHFLSNDMCDRQMETKGAKLVLDLVKNTRFDVIVQDLTNSQCFYALWEIAQGNPPLVGFTPFGSPNWVKDVVGGNNWPAIKQFPHFHIAPPFSLWDKIMNLICYVTEDLTRRYYYMPIQQELGEKFVGRIMSRSVDEMEKNISIVLTNSYAALDPGTFLPPNVIEVGGLHIRNPKPLAQDIKEFLDGAAEHGAIVLSLGSQIKSNTLTSEQSKAMLDALGKLKQRVLWSFDNAQLLDRPKNVMIKEWLSQSDVLAHPNVRVLWSHAGLLSTQEAVWRGIPVVGMPIFMDQYANIDLLVKKGVGLRLDLQSLTAETILKTLNRILTDPSFSRRMKQLSQEFRDRPMSPLDLAVWHVEYAVRHPHGPLISPGRDLSHAQLNLFDVYAFLGVALLSIFLIFWLLLRASLNSIYPQQKKKTA